MVATTEIVGRKTTATCGAYALRSVWNRIANTDKQQLIKATGENKIIAISSIKISILTLIKGEEDKFKAN